MADILDAGIEKLLAESQVPGLSMAVAGGAEIRFSVYGVRDSSTEQPVDSETIFEAASLSKPVASCITLQLAKAGTLSLDTPLARYLPYIPDDPRATTITARHVLSHTTGLPNWRSDTYPLRTYFKPAGRFSYSGEGFLFLQRAIEQACRESFEEIAERLIFAPLGMRRSSFVWQSRFSDNHAIPHDKDGVPQVVRRFTQANAAGSLYTTAGDYARFLQSVLLEIDLGTWLQPHAHVMKNHLTWLDDGSPPETDIQIAWGLGWGVEIETGHFFHWGDQTGFKAFTIGSAAAGRAAVVLTNGDAGLSVMSKLIKSPVPGFRPSLAWLGYEADLL